MKLITFIFAEPRVSRNGEGVNKNWKGAVSSRPNNQGLPVKSEIKGRRKGWSQQSIKFYS